MVEVGVDGVDGDCLLDFEDVDLLGHGEGGGWMETRSDA